MTSLRLLLSNVLYTGAVSYKGTLYAGEQPPIIDKQLWDQVRQNLVQEKLELKSRPRRARSHQKHDAPFAGLLHCGSCGARMVPTYATKAGQRYRYYACATARRSQRNGCAQRQVAAVDLESSVNHQLEPVLGHQLSTPVIQESVERITYQGSTRAVRINLRDGTWSEYRLPEPIRRGVRRNLEAGSGRVPRISRLMALAIRIQALVREGAVGSYRDLAEAGQISPARMSQILRLADLAPSIQEEVLFLPRVLSGADPVTEKDLREVARLTDWKSQRERFEALAHSRLPRGF